MQVGKRTVRLRDVEIIAHRGASQVAPENTLAAAQLAWAEGADALEFDIRLTGDAKLVAIHDSDTRRVAGVTLQVSQSTLAELQQLDVGRWKDARYAGEKIPSLDEMLARVPKSKRVFIEIKGGPEVVPHLAQYVARGGVESERIVVIAFDFSTVEAAKKALPKGSVIWILDRPSAGRLSLEESVDQCRAGRLDGLDLSAEWPLDGEKVKRIHQAGLKVYVWTVDDPVVARRLEAAGVDGLTTNRPGWLREQLAR